MPVRRLPVVLSRDEVAAVLGGLQGVHRVLARLLYGTGMRISEGLQLRVKDVDIAHRALVVREGKGGKDRVVMLPDALVAELRDQLGAARQLWAADVEAGRAGVAMPSDAPGAQVPTGWRKLDLVLGVYARPAFDRSAQWRGAPAPPVCRDLSTGVQAGAAVSRGGQAGHASHLAALFRVREYAETAVPRAPFGKGEDGQITRHMFSGHAWWCDWR